MTPETLMMDHSDRPPSTDAAPERWVRHVHPAFVTPPLLSRCERIPFLLMLGAVIFTTVVVFGITPLGMLCGVGLFLIGRTWLRRKAEEDPYFFAMWWESKQYPRHMPVVEVDRSIGDCAFIGYDKPPTWGQMLWAWSVVIGTGLGVLALLGLFGLVIRLFFFV